MSAIAYFHKIVNDKQSARIDGINVDIPTAQAVILAFKRFNENNRRVFEGMRIDEMIDLGLNIAGR